MHKKILIINAHPDPAGGRLCGALADAYVQGAKEVGHQIRRIDLGSVTFPPVLTGAELEAAPPLAIAEGQDAIRWCDHLVIVFPLWLSAPPALLKSYFEQICRYGFSFDEKHKALLKGRSARLIVTMIIPSLLFRMMFSLGVRGFVRGVLWVSGFKPIKTLALGNVFEADRAAWLQQVKALGRKAA